MNKLFLVTAFLILLGAGCTTVKPAADTAIKDGLDNTQVRPVLSLDEMKVCESDSDCIYADRSVCPYTNYENIVAINKKFETTYMSSQPDKTGIFCIELYAGYEQNPKCVQNICRTPNE